MLSYDFMRRALVVGIMLAVIIPMIGLVMINRKTSMIGDALSHSSLAGIAMGLIFSINPMWTSLIFCILGAFAIDIIRKRFKEFGDMATAIIMSFGIGLAAILSDFAKGGKSFESYLFGSITTVSSDDLILVGIIFILVVLMSLYFYNALLFISINPIMARLAGVKVKTVNSVFTFLTAVTIAISAKIVGALMITSLMVIPVATALLTSKSYKKTYLLSLVYSVIFMLVGITISFYYGLKPGGAIVMIAIGTLVIVAIFKKLIEKIKKMTSKGSLN